MSRYLITFDMDTSCLSENYHSNNPNNAYSDIRNTLKRHGFENIQGSVYLGSDGISEAHGTLALQELTIRYDWFATCVSNIKFYRLESDLDAQFIVDGTNAAKNEFKQRMAILERNLIDAGLSDQQIKKILSQQQFEPNLTQKK